MNRCCRCGIVIHNDYLNEVEHTYFNEDSIKVSWYIKVCNKCLKDNEKESN